ncbi:MAG TPA: BamA/TamA family outer membrane protein, partial [Cryomorphaceae bacterium]|nr:BamA/TamA family outer membrane protein [Cryomorphaceae bacterium]
MIRLFRNITLLILLASCSATKYLGPEERFFEGFEIAYESSDVEIPGEVKSALLSGLEPDPTRRFLISRPGTWLFYQIDSVPKDKGLKYFIKYRLGASPTLLQNVNIDRNAEIIESRIRAAGFFRAQVESELDSTENRASVLYRVTANEPYYFDSLQICKNDKPVCSEIRNVYNQNPILKEGNLFSKNALVEQRTDISNYFKNNGYYFFATPLLYYQADSSSADRKVKLRLELQENVPESALKQFTVDTVIVNLAANSDSKDRSIIGDSLQAIVDKSKLFMRPEKLAPFIAIEPGTLYDRKKETRTIRQLNKLDVFQFVSLEYEVDTTEGKNLLKAKILATPRPKHSLRSELVLTTTSTNFTGPGLQLKYTNRNLFRGAEHLRLSATGRYEWQLSGSRQGLTSYEINLDASLLIPRVSGPLSPNAGKGNVPKTKYNVNYRLFSQPQYYAQSSFGVSYGYEWLTNDFTLHDLKLIRLDYVRLLESSTRLEDLFDDGVLDPESFNDQLIFGPSYNIVFQPERPDYKTNYYLGGSIEFSGNILYAAYSLGDAEENESGQYEISNVPFAQYSRGQLDARVYLPVSDYTELVLRQNVGVGVPYLNSNALPFAKQFFVGGASSLRGFQPREVGPGTYSNPEAEDSFFDQTGDILLEWNAETRFDLGGYLNGAVFLDAGNVWLVNESTSRPGGQFRFDQFIN